VCLLLQYLLQQVAQSYNGIGAVYHSLGQYERALEYYQKYLDITIKISGQESPDVAKSYSCIGDVYRSLGQHEQALKYHQKGSSTIRKVQVLSERPRHYCPAGREQRIERVRLLPQHWQRVQGKSEEGLEMHMKSLDIKSRIYGDRHLLVADTLISMAVAYTQQDKYEEELVQHQKSLDIRIRLAGWFEWFECQTIRAWPSLSTIWLYYTCSVRRQA